ncbi:3'-5' exonuclease [Hymenobacter jeollabukensis]|uniref:Exonuclease n=1 Tax=Hymenobacter jeollabukensis TaxID=2025313 RepID=A0A5R8WM38_9BACT|nr:3'-5' exonuclease [Hymenobacter jeollabukensis]TLM89959.1 exonuclease [Hymenobacter jeollabukensis]
MPQRILQDLHEVNFTAIDFETATERRDSACSIGLVRVQGGQIVDTHQYLIRPVELRMAPMNQRVHGISLQQVLTAAPLPELWPVLHPFIEGQLVVAHNAPFDVSVLEHSLRAYAVPVPDFHSLCSVKLMRASHPGLDSYRLNNLAAHFGLTLNHHDSLSDAVACAELAIRALRSGHPFRWALKQRELTKGIGSPNKPRVARTWRW